MTLQEKFREILKNHFQKNKEEASLLSLINEDNEKIADEFAIEFGKWLNNQVINSSGKHHNLLGSTKVTQLLPIFKKEKGL